MKYIQKNNKNVIVAMSETKPEVTEDENGEWLEVNDNDVIIAKNGKMYYKRVDEVELKEYRKSVRTTEIYAEIDKLETSQARPLREIELINAGVGDEKDKDFAVTKLKKIQSDIEALREELAGLEAESEAA